MATTRTNANGANRAPQAEPKQAPKNEPQKPADNTAAKQAPTETRAAARNAFGDVPGNGGAKQPDSAPKLAATLPGAETTPPPADAKAPAAPEAPAGPQTPAGPQAAPAVPGNAVTDAAGLPVKTPDGKSVILDQNKNPIPVGDNGKPHSDPKGNVYAVDANGKYVKVGDNLYGVYDHSTGKLVASDPKTGQVHKDWAGYPYAVGLDGKYIQPENGKYGAYDQYGNPVISTQYAGLDKDATGNVYSVGPDGKPLKTPDGNAVVVNTANGKPAAIDSSTGKVVADKLGNPYMILPDGKYATTESGEYVAYDKNLGNLPVAIDPKTGRTLTHPSGKPYAIGEDGNYIKSPDGQYNVIYDPKNDNKLAIVNPADGQVVADANGNPYMVQKDGQYAKTSAGNFVVYDKNSGKNPAAIDPKTGQTVKDANGNTLAIGKDGNFITTEDGKANVVYDKNNGNKLAIIDPATGKVAQDARGNPYMVLPTGKFATTDAGNPVVYSKVYGNLPVAIDPKTANPLTDVKGSILAVDDDGNIMKMATGSPIIYEKTGNKYNLAVTDKDGNILKVNDYSGAVDKYGKLMYTQDGKLIVRDKRGNAVPLGKDGKVVTDANGNPLSVDKFGNTVPDVVYDKNTGFKVKTVDGKIQANGYGIPYAVDDNGKIIMDENGVAAVYDPRGIPVQHAGKTPSDIPVFKDLATGEKIGVSGDYVYKIDPKTGDLAKDASGNFLPPLYDPVKQDPSRPQVKPTQNPETTLAKLPKGDKRADPAKLKQELFDEFGNLDFMKVSIASGNYNPIDVYEALIQSSKYGGWEKLMANPHLKPGAELVYPNQKQASEAIAAIIAWQNMNGKYSPIRNGDVPVMLFYKGGPDDGTGGYAVGSDIYVKVTVDEDLPSGTAGALFHELNHSHTSPAFFKEYTKDGKISLEVETVTEYLANIWTGDKLGNSGYELDHPEAFKKIEDVVLKLGDGDRNTGLDILQSAFFAGDLQALSLLKQYLPPTFGVL